MIYVQTLAEGAQQLLTVRQVQHLLRVDRSTIYRMAADGRLPAIRVGRQLRFTSEEIAALVHIGNQADVPDQSAVRATSHGAVDPGAAAAAISVAADLLDVMMVVTDMSGQPLTPVVNQCPWFVEHAGDDGMLTACLTEWRALADDSDLAPRFHRGALGFECARAFIRSGPRLVGMVLAGGVAPLGGANADQRTDGLYQLDPAQRRRVLESLPKIAAALSPTPQPQALSGLRPIEEKP